jgi:hypothetical protein
MLMAIPRKPLVDPSIGLSLASCRHHTKDKGDLGVLKAQLDLFEQGYVILNPVTEHAPLDLVAYRDGVFNRIQVKYKSVDRTDSITVHFCSCRMDKHGTHMRHVNKEEIALYCIYCPDIESCYYLDPYDYGKSVTLRVKTPENNQQQKARLADDYRRVP